jgi:hypothetical protein
MESLAAQLYADLSAKSAQEVGLVWPYVVFVFVSGSE